MKIFCFLLITSLFQSNFKSVAQIHNKSLNEFFILGTLNDYLGRSLDPRKENLLDRYDSSEDVMKSIIDSLIKATYSKKVVQEVEIGVNTISSNFLAARFNTYYNYSASGSSTRGRQILTGKLKHNILRNEQEKLAFLAGVFLRFGTITDTAYRINIANSLSKAEVCNQLLKELGCKPSYNILRNIPSGHHVFFHPTPKVLAYLKKYEKLHKKIEDSRNMFIQNMLKERKREAKPKG